jgi:muramoyltetrapeptide carboxypeptidase
MEAVGYLAAKDEVRAQHLNSLLARNDLDALICVRGGYGVLRILPSIDYEAARRHPKLLVGYSDITALHLAFYQHAQWRGLSAAMVAPDWSQMSSETETDFWQACSGEAPRTLANDLHVLQPGEASGPLLGGNLSIVCALLGTPYLPDLKGSILFVEDIGEPAYRIDGLLARLRLAGVLEKLSGLVFGAFTGAEPKPDRPTLDLDEVLSHYAAFVPGPVASGLKYGHFPNKIAVPVGPAARLEASEGLGILHVTEGLSKAIGSR